MSSNGSNGSKPQLSRSISSKAPKNSFEYDVDGQLSTFYINSPKDSSKSPSSKPNNKSQFKLIKYRKSSSGRTNTSLNSSRSSSLHLLITNNGLDLADDVSAHHLRLADKLRLMVQQKFYVLPQENANCFVVGDNSTRYRVEIGPQTCSCESSSFPCVHLLFVMCKLLRVHEGDPMLLSEKLHHVEVEELLQRFSKRRKEKLRNNYNSSSKKTSINDNTRHLSSSSTRDNLASPGDARHLSLSTDEITCSICLQEMSDNEHLVYCHSCINYFHKNCMLIWMKECRKKGELTCPLCRKRWEIDDLGTDIDSPSIEETSINETDLFLPRSQSVFVANRHIDTSHVNNMASSTSDLTTNFHFVGASRQSEHGSSSTHKPIGYCFSPEVTAMLSSELSDKREAGLRQVAEKTVHIVLSAGSALTQSRHNSPALTNNIVSSMGGHTTGVMLKEAFRVIARLLDDTCYNLFVGALRAFREILGFLVCTVEGDVERMSKMISPVLCQLLRICGDFSQKKKAQMSLSALFELAKGQEGGIALGRELKANSLPVTAPHRLARFVLSDSHRFKAAHCYGRLSLLERLLDKFDLPPDILRKMLEFVTNQLLLMHRSVLLANSFGSEKFDILETTDVDTGLSSSDIRLLSGHRLQKLGKVVFLNSAKVTMAKLKFSGWSTEDIYTELSKDLNKLPQPLKEKFMIKLKIPFMQEELEKPIQVHNVKETKDKGSPLSASSLGNISKSSRLSKRCSQMKPIGEAAKIGSLQTVNSVNSLKLRGNLQQTMRSASSGSCRISPYIRITPEPAYDAVPVSESEDEISRETAFFSELAIHNSIYGHQFGLQNAENDHHDEETILRLSNKILKSIVAMHSKVVEIDPDEIESQAPPGLGVFSTEYRLGYEWCQGSLLGTGAFSKCYQGRDVRTGLLMAVKQISISHTCFDKNEEVIKAVKTEVQLMTNLHHPNVLPLLGAVFSPSDNTISMFVRWMPGGSVASLLNQYGAFLEPVTLAYALQTARGLAYIHSNRILHRDLKGANLLLDSSGMRLRISDFGASARLSNGRDSNAGDFKGQLLGTVAFMAPEVLRGEQYGRSCDVWSYACCIIEMLTGTQPWRDKNHTNHLALMYTIASAEDPPTLPEKISADLYALLIDCLSRDPKCRPLSSQLEHYKVFKNLLL